MGIRTIQERTFGLDELFNIPVSRYTDFLRKPDINYSIYESVKQPKRGYISSEARMKARIRHKRKNKH